MHDVSEPLDLDSAIRALLDVDLATDLEELNDREFARARLDAAICGWEDIVPVSRPQRWRRNPWALAFGIAFAMLVVGGAAAATASLFREGDTAADQSRQIQAPVTQADLDAQRALPAKLLYGLRVGDEPVGSALGELRIDTARNVLSDHRTKDGVDLYAAATTQGWVCLVIETEQAAVAQAKGPDVCVPKFTSARPISWVYLAASDGWRVSGLAADAVASVDVEAGGVTVPAQMGTNAFSAKAPAGTAAPDTINVELIDGTVTKIPVATSEPEVVSRG